MTVKDDRRLKRFPKRSREDEALHEFWLERFHGWLCVSEQELLSHMLYERFREVGLSEEPSPFRKDELEDKNGEPYNRRGEPYDHDYGDYPSFWYSTLGLCAVIKQYASEREISPEQFIESVFREQSPGQALMRLLQPEESHTAKSPSGN